MFSSNQIVSGFTRPLIQNFKVDHAEERRQKIEKIIHSMVKEFGISETWAELKKDKEMKKEFLKLYERPPKFFYKRDPW